MTEPQLPSSSLSIRTLRNLIIVALMIGAALYTAIMFVITDRLSQSLGPQVRLNLEWRAQRGAQELAQAADLGLVIADRDRVIQAFGVYAHSEDVQAIVGVDAAGELVAQHGKVPETLTQIFAGPAGGLRATPNYLVSWAPALVESVVVGKLAVVVSTRRLQEADRLVAQSRDATLLSGLSALVLGMTVVVFFTRAVARRDAQLTDYAANLERKLDERTRELDERNHGMHLVLDNVEQGFVTLSVSDGVLASERSASFDRWFGAPAPGATLSDLLRAQSPNYSDWLEVGLEQLREGFLPAERGLDLLPKRYHANNHIYDVSYRRIGGSDLDRLLVIVSDVTDKLARERAESEQKALLTF
jgi:hypothetical protein